MRLAVVTRSLNAYLADVSGALVQRERFGARAPADLQHYRITGSDSLGYFQELLRLEVDWVINLDEDAFVLDPDGLLDLVAHMDEHGYATCGMPDGGVVPIRHHNPVACNAFFNVFDLRRVRPVWSDWERVVAARHDPRYETHVAPFARRTPFAFDHFERYYGVFLALWEAGERILFLDAETWSDGVTTLLRGPTGKPLLLHCWYTRHWLTSYHTRQRYHRVIDYARSVQGCSVDLADPAGPSVAPVNPETSLLGKWASLYQNVAEPMPFGDPLTYTKAARFLAGLSLVEDWGCGFGWFQRYLDPSTRYRGLDGSCSVGTDEVVDLTTYTSEADGILLRHVLEHNFAWAAILDHAVQSFRQRLVLILFTPFVAQTQILQMNATLGVPDLAFARLDLVRRFGHLRWTLEENLRTQTQYGVEHIFYVTKP